MSPRKQAGFTLVELLVSMVVIGIVVIASYTYFNSSSADFFSLEKDSIAFNDLAVQSQRIAKVVRGLTDVSAAAAADLTVYAYFSPDDTYVSQIHYYTANNNTVIKADVTPMTANPPDGALITAKKRVYTIMVNYLKLPNTDLFEYLDSTGDKLTLPISDLHIIKGIRINLAVPVNSPTAQGNHNISVQVALRNRKTNL